jgi:UDP-N-acetylmuramyl pentapeptide phosphotransferase/UDP-N-acetylglucosamine-1-phosphate transferase
MQLIACLLIALVTSAMVLNYSLISRLAISLLDKPNERSLHKTPTPRIGGLGIIVGFAIASLVQHQFFNQIPFAIQISLLCYSVLFAVSWFDDLWSLTAIHRLFVQVLTATIWVAVMQSSYFPTVPAWALLAVSLIVCVGLVWAMNLFNFMDGSDGLAGSMAVVGFTAYLVCTLTLNLASVSLTAASVIGAIIGFLFFNWPKAKIFLGDSGSVPIGFLAASMGVIGILEGWWTVFFPLQIFAMFWIDASYTLLRRIYRKEKFWHAHNQHWYQRAIRAGNSHRKVLLIHLGCNICIAGLSVIPYVFPNTAATLNQATTITTVLIITLGFGMWSEMQFKQFESKKSKQV